MFQLLCALGGPRGPLGFEALSRPEEIVFLRFEIRDPSLRPLPGGIRLARLRRGGLRLRLKFRPFEIELGRRGSHRALAAIHFFHPLRQFGRAGLRRRVLLGLLRPQVSLQRFPFAALLCGLRLKPLHRLVELGGALVDVLLLSAQDARLG